MRRPMRKLFILVASVVSLIVLTSNQSGKAATRLISASTSETGYYFPAFSFSPSLPAPEILRENCTPTI